ncbi:MAG: hypothetical protein V4542_06650 [Pseudomonadota bacterium]
MNEVYRKTKRDDREQCMRCCKTMVPRLRFYLGAPYESFCPFCGGLHKAFTAELPNTPGIFEVLAAYLCGGLALAVVIWVLFISFQPFFKPVQPDNSAAKAVLKIKK